ncbi:MAG TPA: hypothetical protein PLP34_11220, partial [Chitinophagaceae bacterium]|nr:hypothetical protein [Chitinophagaceae bacterium]
MKIFSAIQNKSFPERSLFLGASLIFLLCSLFSFWMQNMVVLLLPFLLPFTIYIAQDVRRAFWLMLFFIPFS